MAGEAQEITLLLAQARAGEAPRLAALFQAVYPELRRIAIARAGGRGQTLSPTVLVNELYLRLSAGGLPELSDRKHFFVVAAQAMRWIVVDHARRAHAAKRGGECVVVTLDDNLAEILPGGGGDAQILALNDSLDALEAISPEQRQVVELRWFAGLEYAEIAGLLGVSERTAKRLWERARAFLHAQLAG